MAVSLCFVSKQIAFSMPYRNPPIEDRERIKQLKRENDDLERRLAKAQAYQRRYEQEQEQKDQHQDIHYYNVHIH